MRTPRPGSVPLTVRWPVLRGGVLFALAIAAAMPVPARGDDSNWREVRRGRDLFLREWRPDDPRCHGGDGLGPLYNANSCVACHRKGGTGGAGPASTNVDLLSLASFQRITVGGNTQAQRLSSKEDGGRVYSRDEVIARLHPALRESASIVLHHSGTDPRYAAWRSAILGLDEESANGTAGASRKGGAYMPDRTLVRELGQSRLATITRRNPTPLFGMGLIDAISDEVILAAATRANAGVLSTAESVRPALQMALRVPLPRLSSQAHGRVHRLKDGRVGKFGWKAQVGSLQDFVLTACSNELGLESPGHRQAAPPFAADSLARKPDLSVADCDALVAFVRDLPAPVVHDLGDRGAYAACEGRALFATTGCASCHIPKLGDVDGIYSDLLLHDMGRGLSDSGQYYGASDSGSPDSPRSTEWRTPPLWGVRDSGPYLHDGRAATLREAIALHGGEARDSAALFKTLSIEDRFRIETFLNSLAAPATGKELERRRDLAREGWELDEHAADAEVRGREVRRNAPQAADSEQVARAVAARVERQVAGRLRMAEQTERNGNARAALALYREIVESDPVSPSAARARERIKAMLAK